MIASNAEVYHLSLKKSATTGTTKAKDEAKRFNNAVLRVILCIFVGHNLRREIRQPASLCETIIKIINPLQTRLTDAKLFAGDSRGTVIEGLLRIKSYLLCEEFQVFKIF